MRAGRMTLLLGCALLFLATLLAGCNPSTRTPKPGTGDPLMGEMYPKKFEVGPVPPRSSKSTGVPPVPQATSATSTVGLLGGAEPLNGGKPLAIQDSATRGDTGWQVPGQKSDSQPRRDDVKLQAPRTDMEPVPVAPFGRSTQGAIQPVSYAGSGGYEQLQEALRHRGVTWQRQETYADGFKFTCSVPNPANRDFSRIYEATARDYRAAIQAVLEQIDRQRR